MFLSEGVSNNLQALLAKEGIVKDFNGSKLIRLNIKD